MSEVLNEGTELDPNSDAGFNALLARAAGGSLSDEQREALESADRSVSSGLTNEESAQAGRDEKGRFTAAAPTSDAKPEGEAPAGEEIEDDGLTKLLERYGDPNTALSAVSKERDEAQSLIGRQGNELGQLRQEMAELRGRLEGIHQATPAPSAPLVSLDQVEQNFADEFGHNGTGHATMRWIVDNRPDMIDQATELWGQYNPTAAAAFSGRFAALQTLQGAQAQPVAPAPVSLDNKIAEAVSTVRSGMSDAEWKQIHDHLTPALERAPKAIQELVISDDPDLRVQGMSVVAELAMGRAIASATAKAREQEVARLNASKGAAQVASGSLRPVQERKPAGGAETTEDVTKRFHEALLRTETTSVADGLTFSR